MKRILIALLALWTGIQTVSAQIPELKPLLNLDEALTPVQKKSKWGFCNGRGKVVIKPVFDFAEDFSPVTAADGTTMQVARIRVGGKWGYITRENVYLIVPDYDTISRFDNNAMVVAHSGPSKMLIGVRSIMSPRLQVPVLTGNILQVNISELREFNSLGYAWASRADKWGLLGANGQWVVPCEYSAWYEFPELDMYGVEKDNKAGLMTMDGKTVVPVAYDRIAILANKMLLVEKDGLKGVLAQDGTQVLTPAFQNIFWDDNLGYVASVSGMYGRYTEDGQELYPCAFPEIPDPENTDYVPLVKEGTPCIYIAGDGLYTVGDYDERLFNELGPEEYEASTILPKWMKANLPYKEKYVTMTGNMPPGVEIPEGFDGSSDQCADIRFKCGASLADVVLQDEFESIDPQVKIWDGGEKVYILLHAVEEYWVLYEYNSVTGDKRTFSVTGNMVCDPVVGVLAETGVWGDDVPLAEFFPMNFPARADIRLFPILRYTFHSWAGVPYVLLGASVNGAFEMMPVAPGETVNAGVVSYGPGGQYCQFHAHVRDAAENGIAMYELVATEYVYGTPGNPDELVAKTPVVVACGYIGLTRPYFTQPLFYEARDFKDDGALVRIGDDWFAKKSADIIALDPFIQPED